MALARPLARPPIVEALADFRIAVAHPITRDDLRPIVDRLKAKFPTEEEKRSFRAEFRVDEGRLIPPSTKDLGFQSWALKAPDGNRIVQLRADGGTVNHVGPYAGGDVLLDDAVNLWRAYADAIKPDAVTKIELRYINRIELPISTGEEFTKYLVSPPAMPTGAPEKISEFLSRIVAHDVSGAAAIVVQKLDPGAEKRVPLLIDIDVLFGAEMDPVEDDVRARLESLRELKNRCFFSLLTEETVKLLI